jgi:hypothetical protein
MSLKKPSDTQLSQPQSLLRLGLVKETSKHLLDFEEETIANKIEGGKVVFVAHVGWGRGERSSASNVVIGVCRRERYSSLTRQVKEVGLPS